MDGWNGWYDGGKFKNMGGEWIVEAVTKYKKKKKYFGILGSKDSFWFVLIFPFF